MFKTANPYQFSQALLAARLKNPLVTEFVDWPNADAMESFRLWLHSSGDAGVAVKPSREISMLFSTQKGLGSQALDLAIANGGTWLSCFAARGLLSYYLDYGFDIACVEPNWSGHGLDYAYLALPGHKKDITVYGGVENLCTLALSA